MKCTIWSWHKQFKNNICAISQGSGKYWLALLFFPSSSQKTPPSRKNNWKQYGSTNLDCLLKLGIELQNPLSSVPAWRLV